MIQISRDANAARGVPCFFLISQQKLKLSVDYLWEIGGTKRAGHEMM